MKLNSTMPEQQNVLDTNDSTNDCNNLPIVS